MPCFLNSGTRALTVCGLVAEGQPGHAGGHHDGRRVLQREADEGHGDALEALDVVRREQRLAAGIDHRARREVPVARALERLRPLAAVDRAATAALHAQQLGRTLVELVVADRADLEPHRTQRFDRRLVVEQRRQQRRRADQVAGGDEDVIRVLRAQFGHRRGELLGAAGRHVDRLRRVGRVLDADAALRGLQVAVEVVDRQDLHLHRRCRRRCRAARQHRDGEEGDRPVQAHGRVPQSLKKQHSFTAETPRRHQLRWTSVCRAARDPPPRRGRASARHPGIQSWEMASDLPRSRHFSRSG